MIRPTRRFLRLLPLLMLLALFSLPGGQAQAHRGWHPYENVVGVVEPAALARGVELRVLDMDREMELTNRSGRTVEIIGYEREPYARIESGGPVSVNAMSPSMAPSNDRMGETQPNGNEDADAAPVWVQVGDGGVFRWFDRRAEYRREGDPAALQDRTERQKLWDYRIPIRVGGEPAVITGSLYWTGKKPFPTVLFLLLLVATAGGAMFGAWVLKRQRQGDGEAGAGGLPDPVRE